MNFMDYLSLSSNISCLNLLFSVSTLLNHVLGPDDVVANKRIFKLMGPLVRLGMTHFEVISRDQWLRGLGSIFVHIYLISGCPKVGKSMLNQGNI